jgi:hypothetical protein
MFSVADHLPASRWRFVFSPLFVTVTNQPVNRKLIANQESQTESGDENEEENQLDVFPFEIPWRPGGLFHAISWNPWIVSS